MIESSNMTRITPSSGMLSPNPRDTHMIAPAISESESSESCGSYTYLELR